MISWTALLLDRKTTVSAAWVVRGGGGQSRLRLPGRASSRTSAYGLVQKFSRQSTRSSAALPADCEPASKTASRTVYRPCKTSMLASLLSGRNLRWPRRMMPPGESRWVCRRDRQTDGRQTFTIRFPLDVAGVIICLGLQKNHGEKWKKSRQFFKPPNSRRIHGASLSHIVFSVFIKYCVSHHNH